MSTILAEPTVETPAPPVALETPAAEPAFELAKYRAEKTAPPAPVVETPAPVAPVVAAPVVEAVEPAEPVIPELTAPTHERWQDPATGEVLDMRTRRAKRIKALWGELEDAKRENATLRTRAESAPAPAVSSQPAPTPQTFTRPKPTEEEVGTKYPTYGAFVEDLSDWKVEQHNAAQARIESGNAAVAAHRSLVEAHLAQLPAAKTRYADFDAVMARPLPVQVPLDHPFAVAILESPISADLMYALSSAPQEYARLAQLAARNPRRALAELGLFEAQVKAGLEPAQPAPIPPAVLPAPIPPVGGSGTATAFNYGTATLEQVRAHKKANGGRY